MTEGQMMCCHIPLSTMKCNTRSGLVTGGHRLPKTHQMIHLMAEKVAWLKGGLELCRCLIRLLCVEEAEDSPDASPEDESTEKSSDKK